MPGLADPVSARLWLQSAQQDPSSMRAMRIFLAAHFEAGELFRTSDEMVIRRVADLLASGRVHLHHGSSAAAPVRGGAVQSVQADLPAPFPLLRAASRAPAAVSQPAEDEFLPDVDLLAQVMDLTVAAASGKPFCVE